MHYIAGLLRNFFLVHMQLGCAAAWDGLGGNRRRESTFLPHLTFFCFFFFLLLARQHLRLSRCRLLLTWQADKASAGSSSCSWSSPVSCSRSARTSISRPELCLCPWSVLLIFGGGDGCVSCPLLLLLPPKQGLLTIVVVRRRPRRIVNIGRGGKEWLPWSLLPGGAVVAVLLWWCAREERSPQAESHMKVHEPWLDIFAWAKVLFPRGGGAQQAP